MYPRRKPLVHQHKVLGLNINFHTSPFFLSFAVLSLSAFSLLFLNLGFIISQWWRWCSSCGHEGIISRIAHFYFHRLKATECMSEYIKENWNDIPSAGTGMLHCPWLIFLFMFPVLETLYGEHFILRGCIYLILLRCISAWLCFVLRLNILLKVIHMLCFLFTILLHS